MEIGICTDMPQNNVEAGASSEGEASSSSSTALPQEVLPLILSKTTAHDVGRLALVNRIFSEAAKSDLVWRKMLPPNYEWIAENAFECPIVYQSLKELYERFSKHILVGEGLEGVGCDPKTGEWYWTFSARTLYIIWGSEPSYWRWLPRTEVQGSRFPEVAYLVSVCWLELKGEIQKQFPPGTYSLGWVLRFARRPHPNYADEDYGFLGKWHGAPVTFTFTYGEDVQLSEVEFPPRMTSGELGDVHKRVQWKEDNWLEYNAGVFTVEEEDNAQVGSTPEVKLKFEMRETADLWWKRGLFVDGVIIRQHSSTSEKKTELNASPSPVSSEV